MEMAQPVDLLSATLKEVVEALDSGTITCEELVEEYLARIERDNHAGLGLRAVLETAPRVLLLEQARRLDATRKAGKRSILHGVPIVIKDTIATHPDLGMKTGGGTHALCNNEPVKNASVVNNLLNAGLIIMGKANLTVMNNYYTIDMISGWSPRGGQTVSPYDPTLGPSGSSTGSAVSLTAGFCASAVGSESYGSIVSPAYRAALFALRMSAGLIPLEGVMCTSHDLDTLGPMGKSAWDIAAMLDVMTPPSTTRPSYLETLYAPVSSGRQLRLGVPRHHYQLIKAEDIELFEQALSCLGGSSSIAIAQDPADIEGAEILLPKAKDTHWWGPQTDVIARTDLYGDFNRYVEGTVGPIRDLEDLVKWNAAHPDLAFHPESLPGAGQVLLEAACTTKGVPDEAYHKAKEELATVAESTIRTLDKYDLDALIFPPMKAYAAAISSSGVFPICTVPFKLDKAGHPFGVMILARKGDDQTLLRIMAACEAIFPARAVPSALSGAA